MDVHPPKNGKNGINRYWSIPTWSLTWWFYEGELAHLQQWTQKHGWGFSTRWAFHRDFYRFTIWLWHSQFAMERSTMLFSERCLPSISINWAMEKPWRTVSHNQMVSRKVGTWFFGDQILGCPSRGPGSGTVCRWTLWDVVRLVVFLVWVRPTRLTRGVSLSLNPTDSHVYIYIHIYI